MTTKELLRGLSDLNAEQILEAEAYAARSPRPWVRWVATAACVAVVAAASWQLALRPAETPPPADRGEAENAETDDGVAARPDDGAAAPDGDEVQAEPARTASETLGGVAINMSPSEVTAVLGDDCRVSEPVEWPEYGYRYQVWSYPELRVRFVDMGDGWSVGELMTTEDSAATLSSGIGLDASREEITAAYPDAEIAEQDGVWSAYVPYEDCALWIFDAPDGACIRLAARTPDPEPVGNTLSAETIRVVAADGTEVTLVDKAAKRVGTVLTIMEPEPAENPGEAPGWWLDFGNGTYLAVYGHDDLATVYTGDALDPAAMTEQLTGIYLDLDATLAGALENPTETWE